MHNQSYNQLPLATNQSHNDISIQMTPNMHQTHMNQIPQNQIPQNQQYIQGPIPQINQQHYQYPQQYQHHGQMMSQPQMIQNYPVQQQQYIMHPQCQKITFILLIIIEFKNQVTSRHTQPLYCSNCQRVVPTLVEFEPGKGALVSGLLIGMLGCWAGCCLIPCCNEDFQDAVHSCTICAQKLGKKQFLFD